MKSPSKYPLLLSLIILILTSIQIAHAQDSCVQSRLTIEPLSILCPVPIKAEDFSKAYEETINPYIRTTSREVSFFSYGTRSGDGKVGLDEIINLPSDDKSFSGPVSLHPKDSHGRDIGAEYLKSMATAATHSSDQTWELGRGLYTATEPLASISYSGKSQGFLLKVNVPAKSNYLDLRLDHRSLPLKSHNAKILGCFLAQQDPEYFKKYEYPMKSLVETINGINSKFDFTDFMRHAASRELISKIFSKRKLVFTAGGYGEYNYKECHLDDRQHFMTMAVFQNPDALKNVTTEVFVPSLEKGLTEDKKKAYSDLRDYFSIFDCETAELRDNRKVRLCGDDPASKSPEFKRYSDALNNALPPIKATNSKKRHTITRNLFGCDPKIKSEYDPPTQIKADEH